MKCVLPKLWHMPCSSNPRLLCVCVRVWECECVWTTMSSKSSVRRREGKNWMTEENNQREELTGLFSAVLLTYLFKDFALPHPVEHHLCQWLLSSLSGCKCAWSNHGLLFYIYCFISKSSIFFLLFFKLSLFLCALSLFHAAVRQTPLTKVISAWPGYDVRAEFSSCLETFLNHCILKKHLCDCTDCCVILLLISCVFLWVGGGEQAILHDPAVSPELLYIPFVIVSYSTVPTQ